MLRVEFSSHQQLLVQSHQLVESRLSQKLTFGFVCPLGTCHYDTAA